MIMYVLVRIEDIEGTFTVDPCGVYSEPDDAFDWMTELELLNKDPENVIFDALEFDLDEEPAVLGWMKGEKQALIDNIDKTLRSLCERGMIEQLVGEDGRFYYELTHKGETTMKGIPGQVIQRFIDDKNEKL